MRKRAARAARALTTPLLPDDYLALLDPRWSARELVGRVHSKRRETDDAATLVFEPQHPWPGHVAGQYLRLGVELDGVRQWRAYTITSDPDPPQGLVSVTIKRNSDGKLSPYFVDEIRPGDRVFLGEVEGCFTLPDDVPDKLLMISAGGGITPIWSLLRELARRNYDGDVFHLHGARPAEYMIFGEPLRALHEQVGGYELHEH